MELEKIVNRDGRSVTEALPLCRKLDPTLTMETLKALAARLPERTPRPRPVNVDLVSDELQVAGDSVSESAFSTDRKVTAQTAGEVIRATIAGFSQDDRLLFRLHFGAGMTIATIARTQGMEQKPLYRRLQRCLRELRRKLEAAGISADAALEAAEMRTNGLDLGLDEESDEPRPSETDVPGGKRGGSR